VEFEFWITRVNAWSSAICDPKGWPLSRLTRPWKHHQVLVIDFQWDSARRRHARYRGAVCTSSKNILYHPGRE